MPWIIAGATLLGGYMGSRSASKAADTQANATGQAAAATAAAQNNATAELGRQYDITRSDTAPWRSVGGGAITQLGTLASGTGSPLTRKFSISDFWNDPVVQAGYQSGLDLGTKALKNAAPLTTGLDSGAAMKELVKFGTDYTGQKANESYGRFTNDQGNVYNKLAGLAGIGQTANTNLAQVGASTSGDIARATMTGGTNMANLISGMGNARAASSIAGGNAVTGGLNSIANWWQQQNMLNQMQRMQLNNQYGAGNVYYPGSAGTIPSNPDMTQGF